MAIVATYSPLEWENGVTPLNATNLNNMEQGIWRVTEAVNGLGNIGEEFAEVKQQMAILGASVLRATFDDSTGTLRIVTV